MNTSTGASPRPQAVVVGLDCITGLQTARLLARRGISVIGIASKECGDADAAIEHFQESARLAPENIEAWVALGNMQKLERRFSEAAESYRQAIAINAYHAAAKAGLIGFTKAVAREVASRNVTVNAIAPGYIDTGGMVGQLSEEAKAQILGRIPMGRFGNGAEVAEVVAFLCSQEAGYITGQVLTIDGGLIA